MRECIWLCLCVGESVCARAAWCVCAPIYLWGFCLQELKIKRLEGLACQTLEDNDAQLQIMAENEAQRQLTAANDSQRQLTAANAHSAIMVRTVGALEVKLVALQRDYDELSVVQVCVCVCVRVCVCVCVRASVCERVYVCL